MKFKLPLGKFKSFKRQSVFGGKKSQKKAKKEKEQEEIKQRLRNLGYW